MLSKYFSECAICCILYYTNQGRIQDFFEEGGRIWQARSASPYWESEGSALRRSRGKTGRTRRLKGGRSRFGLLDPPICYVSRSTECTWDSESRRIPNLKVLHGCAFCADAVHSVFVPVLLWFSSWNLWHLVGSSKYWGKKCSASKRWIVCSEGFKAHHVCIW